MVFTPGGAPASGEEAEVRLAAAQARIETLARRCRVLEDALAATERNAARAQHSELESQLRGEISRLEGSLAQARAEARKVEAATRGDVQPGKRPIEIE
jgi:chromosome segregation ATPase